MFRFRNRVTFTADEVRRFNANYPRAVPEVESLWFEFDKHKNLVDCKKAYGFDIDGLDRLTGDARDYMFYGRLPVYADRPVTEKTED
jgi:hypothetical protein